MVKKILLVTLRPLLRRERVRVCCVIPIIITATITATLTLELDRFNMIVLFTLFHILVKRKLKVLLLLLVVVVIRHCCCDYTKY